MLGSTVALGVGDSGEIEERREDLCRGTYIVFLDFLFFLGDAVFVVFVVLLVFFERGGKSLSFVALASLLSCIPSGSKSWNDGEGTSAISISGVSAMFPCVPILKRYRRVAVGFGL